MIVEESTWSGMGGWVSYSLPFSQSAEGLYSVAVVQCYSTVAQVLSIIRGGSGVSNSLHKHDGVRCK